MVRMRSMVVVASLSWLAASELAAIPPNTPLSLSAVPNSDKQIRLAWLDSAKDESGFKVEVNDNGTFRVVKTVGANLQGAVVGGLQENRFYQFRIRSFNGSGSSAPSNVASAFTDDLVPPSSCVPSAVVACLGPTNRFRVSGAFKVANVEEPALVQEVRGDAAVLTFFDSNNIDALINVLNACSGANPRYWVFAAGVTSVQQTLTVTDTTAGRTRTYFNPAGRPFAPIQDTSAFATCP